MSEEPDDITRARIAKFDRELSESVFEALSRDTPAYTDAPIMLLKREFEKAATPERIAEIARHTTPENFAAFVIMMEQYLRAFAEFNADPSEIRLLRNP